MTNTLLDVSRMEAGEMPLEKERVLLKELAKEAVKVVRSLNKGEASFEARGDATRVDCDPKVMTRVLTNLLSNALKFSNNGDELTVDIERTGTMPSSASRIWGQASQKNTRA